MRFFFEYITCCMMITTSCTNKEAPSSQGTLSKADDETRSLVTTAPSRIGRRRKRTPTRSSSAEWQPSLFAIAEDNVISATQEKVAEKVNRQPVKQQSTQRNVKRCGMSSGRVTSHTSSYDFSSDSIQMVVPAFSAAPFMF